MNNIYYQYIILHKAKNQVDLFQGARDMFTLKIYAKMIKIRNENVTFSSIYSDFLLIWGCSTIT